MASEDPCADITNSRLRRKDSKLKRAVTFFKHLGLKNCSRHKRFGSSSAPETESFDTWLAKRQRFEVEDNPHDPVELATTDSNTRGYRSKPERLSKTVYEMEGSALYATWNHEDIPVYSQEAGTAVEPCELDAVNVIEAPQTNGPGNKIDGPLTGVGAQFEASQHDAEPCEEIFVSPVSTIQSPFVCQSTGVDSSCHAECGLVSPTYDNYGTVRSPEVIDHNWRQIKVTPALNESLPSSHNDGSLCDGETLTTKSQVEELCEMVRVLNEEWMRRCHSTPDLVLRASAVSPRSLFEIGAQTLQHIFRGVLPSTFDAVFALAHVSCAIAYIMHRDDTSHCWNEFFQDILKWQHLIPNESDAGLFIRFVNLLWWPQGSSANLSCGEYFLDETSGTLVPLRRPAVGFGGPSSTETIKMQPPRWPTKTAPMPVLNSLKNGAVLQECLSFLDGQPTYQKFSIIN